MQGSVVSDVPAVDEFDETCKTHDAAYASMGDLKKADMEFAYTNIGKGVKRTIAGLVVGLQGLMRSERHMEAKVLKLSSLDIDMPAVARRRKSRKSSKKTMKRKSKARYKRKGRKYRKRNKSGKSYGKGLLGDKIASVIGYQANTEFNGARATGNCVYVGYGTPAAYVFTSTIRALYKKLLMRAGMTVRNWTDRFDTYGDLSYIIRIHFYTDTNIFNPSEPLVAAQSISTGATGALHLTVVSNLEALIKQQYRFGTSANLQTPHFLKWELHHTQDIANLEGTKLSEINVEQSIIHFKNVSQLKVQNRTLAPSAGEAADADAVDRVPLVGKAYDSNEWRDGFLPIRADGQMSTEQPFKLPTAGAFTRTPPEMDEDSVNNVYRKPPPAFMLGCKKAQKFILNPGQVLADSVVFKCKMSANNVMKKYVMDGRTSTLTTISAQDGTSFNPMGRVKVLAMEKYITPASIEQNIDIAWQIDHKMTAVVTESRTRTQPLTIATF